MDDKRIEEMLRESWATQPPDGMRERTLRRARAELRRRRRPAILQWKPLLASLAVLILLATGISDHCRQSRLSLMVGSSPSKIVMPPEGNWLKWRREMERSLALVSPDTGLPNGQKGDDLL